MERIREQIHFTKYCQCPIRPKQSGHAQMSYRRVFSQAIAFQLHRSGSGTEFLLRQKQLQNDSNQYIFVQNTNLDEQKSLRQFRFVSQESSNYHHEKTDHTVFLKNEVIQWIY